MHAAERVDALDGARAAHRHVEPVAAAREHGGRCEAAIVEEIPRAWVFRAGRRIDEREDRPHRALVGHRHAVADEPLSDRGLERRDDHDPRGRAHDDLVEVRRDAAARGVGRRPVVVRERPRVDRSVGRIEHGDLGARVRRAPSRDGEATVREQADAAGVRDDVEHRRHPGAARRVGLDARHPTGRLQSHVERVIARDRAERTGGTWKRDARGAADAVARVELHDVAALADDGDPISPHGHAPRVVCGRPPERLADRAAAGLEDDELVRVLARDGDALLGKEHRDGRAREGRVDRGKRHRHEDAVGTPVPVCVSHGQHRTIPTRSVVAHARDGVCARSTGVASVAERPSVRRRAGRRRAIEHDERPDVGVARVSRHRDERRRSAVCPRVSRRRVRRGVGHAEVRSAVRRRAAAAAGRREGQGDGPRGR